MLAEKSKRNPDEETIRKLDAEWSAAVQNKDVEKTVSFYAEDAVVLPTNEPKATGKVQIRDFFTRFLASPGLGVSFGPTKIEVAKSKDMAYDVRTYELKLNDPQGNPTTIIGKYVVVGKKQPEKRWKALADIFSPDVTSPAQKWLRLPA